MLFALCRLSTWAETPAWTTRNRAFREAWLGVARLAFPPTWGKHLLGQCGAELFEKLGSALPGWHCPLAWGSNQPGRHGPKLLEIAAPWWVSQSGRLAHAEKQLNCVREPQLERQVHANEQLNMGWGYPNFNFLSQSQFSNFFIQISLLYADALPTDLEVE